MKIHKKPTPLTFILFIAASLAWNLTSASTPRTDLIEVEEKVPEESRPDFTGVWANEGELSALNVLANGTCNLEYDDRVHGVRGLEISGRWIRRGRVLTVILKDEWQGKKVHIYHFVRKDWDDGGRQDLLMIRDAEGEESFAFYRVTE